ncbi:MAG: transposase [Geobacteraceae bacterium]|nr:MAG: transposase [Geobacteraceae bacterium]
MAFTAQIFEAYLKCPSKCWFRSLGEEGTGNMYADWVRMQNDAYRTDGIERLLNSVTSEERAVAQADSANVKTAKWKFAANFPARKENLETSVHIVERVPSEGRGKPAQFTPIRFIFPNKLSKDDKLLLAYDAFVLSEMLRRDVSHGKIIHGDNHTTVKVRTSALESTVRKLTAKIAALLASDLPPDFILNRHCAECEYQVPCRQKAIEKDDLSLLAGMTEKERKKLNSKGIFTITQLSYTFRPRRRPKRLRDKREKYLHSLKALAIREKKIHIVGNPELKIECTPVYLDVEGLPDRDFYYLIGIRFRIDDSVEQHSLWADSREDEEGIWREFLRLLESVEKPVLICYGSYEMTFLKAMCGRYGGPCQGSIAEKAISSVINILSFIYGRVYFPVPSNGLKDIAGFCGFQWTEADASGIQSIVWREKWEAFRDSLEHERLTSYNTEDCEALEVVTRRVLSLQCPQAGSEVTNEKDIVDISKQKREHPYGFKRNTFVLPEFDSINKAAYWDYQRERVFIKSDNAIRHSLKHPKKSKKTLTVNKIIYSKPPKSCPNCSSNKFQSYIKSAKRIVIDLKFTPCGIKRWVTQHQFNRYKCFMCGKTFPAEHGLLSKSKYGSELIAFVVYQCIELRSPIMTIEKNINRLFGLHIGEREANHFKVYAANLYATTYNALISILCNGNLLHADETKMSLRDKSCFVWVLTSMEEVVYICTETREGEYVNSLLKDFKGVLVSDFYTAYDSINCPQQKCLIHLIRDINDALYKHPYDEGLKRVANEFTKVLRPMVETVDRFGLKHYFLKKHLPDVDRFYKNLKCLALTTETSEKLRERFEKNRSVLFTFLSYDGIPWNNNNAEHAVKAFAMLRHIIKGVTTEKGLRDYLILLSICETCKYKGLDFLDFLRSGEKNIDVFAESQRRRRGRHSAVLKTEHARSVMH